MDIFTIIFIAVGLAMDAFAVSIAGGVAIKQLKIRNALKIALFFGGFQAIMPVLGWLAGLSVKGVLERFDHWIVFGLLTLIGCKMIYESFKLEPSRHEEKYLQVTILLLLSIATSIDALAVGISFALMEVSIINPVLIIGIITFLLSYMGVYIGNRLGHLFENRMEIAGGCILIGMGLKILLQHTVLS
jgi:putative Mn2+ efflux pump MntP